MPTKTIDMRYFDKGAVTSPDVKDIHPDAYRDGVNIDGDIDGRLRGIPTNGAAYQANGNVEIPDVRIGDMIMNSDGEYDLIYHDPNDGNIKAVTNFYGTEANRTLVDFNTGTGIISGQTALVTDYKSLRVGVNVASSSDPRWIGHIDQGQFDYGVSWTISGATNASPIVITVTTTHNLNNGAIVKIASVGGNTAANGVWVVANTDCNAKTFELLGSTGNGVYTTGGTASLRLSNNLMECSANKGTSSGQFELITIAFNGAPAATDLFFLTTKGYMWAYSLIYDGYQESPLAPFSNTLQTPGADNDYCDITIRANGATPTAGNPAGASVFNKRITGINIYRAEGDLQLGISSLEIYRLVGFIDINDNGWTTSTDDKTFTIRDYGGSALIPSTGAEITSILATYEENTGIPETLEDPFIFYQLACKGEGFLFVGKCHHPSISEASQVIFRSKEQRFDMFNWIEDIIRLPRVPTAMAYFFGRLYAFDLNTMYRINPDLMLIEEEYHGSGAMGQRSVCVTPYGMFFANQQGAWMFDGKEVVPISNRIKRTTLSGGASWKALSFADLPDIIVIYMAKRGDADASTPLKFGSNYVLFINTSASDNNSLRCWAYHIQKDRWDFWDFGADIDLDANSGVFQGKDGEVFLSNASNSVELLAGNSRQNFTFISQEFSEDTSQDKWWSDLVLNSTGAGSVTATYGIEGAAPTTSLTSTTQIRVYAKTLQFKLVSSGVKDVDSVSLIVRPLVGSRVYA